MTINLQNIEVTLLPEHAVWLPKTKTLIAADIHLGKSATFRTRGIPVPEGDTETDLATLSRLITTHRPTQLIIAGDLIHAHDGMTKHTLELLETWLENSPIPVTLTEGNHDQKSNLTKFKIEILPHIEIEGLRITHHPKDLPANRAGIAGHIHPAFHLKDSHGPAMKLKGFHLRHPHHLILPAFSQFTGTHKITPEPNDRFFSVTQNHLHEIPIKT